MLTLYNVTEEEGGEYICKVSNYIGEANQSAWLTVIKYDPSGNHHAAAQGQHTGGVSRTTWKNLEPETSSAVSLLPPSVLPALPLSSVILTVNDAMENSQQNS